MPKPRCFCGECPKCKRRKYMADWYARHPGKRSEANRRAYSKRVEGDTRPLDTLDEKALQWLRDRGYR